MPFSPDQIVELARKFSVQEIQALVQLSEPTIVRSNGVQVCVLRRLNLERLDRIVMPELNTYRIRRANIYNINGRIISNWFQVRAH